jgi:protoporphyrinogen oxidase
MWEVCRDKVEAQGSKVVMETRITSIRHRDGRATSVVVESEGGQTEHPCSHVISSMPISGLVLAMDPPAPPAVQAAAKGLAYRDFLTVALVVPESAGFPDNWIYVHSPEVRLGRIQNFGSWSPYLVKEGRTCLGLEYFVFEGDDLWASDDADLVELGKRELEKIGLVKAADVETGYVVRMPKAYPVYDETYKANVDTIRAWLDANAPNVYPTGRNGMHRYNNQDHSMYTAMLSVENIFGARHDIWNVNVEEEYHEEKSVDLREGGGEKGTGRAAPITPRRKPVEVVLPSEADVEAG